SGEKARFYFHGREYVLVVQYVFHCGHQRHAAADVSGRWPENSGPLRRAAGAPRRAQPPARAISAVHVLGSDDLNRVEPLDRPGDRACPQDAQSDADALLPPASRLLSAEIWPRARPPA